MTEEMGKITTDVNVVGFLRNVIQSCFENPHLSLGGVSEVNCQSKMVFPTLWALGWDPVHQLFLNFQIAKEHMKKSPKMASAAADIVAGTKEGIYLVCEVKYWNSPYLANSTDQVREYQEALNAPRACLTNGKRWMIFDKDNDCPLIDQTFSNVDEMLALLKEWISPQAIMAPFSYPYLEAFELGISTIKRRRPFMKFDQEFNTSNTPEKESLWVKLLDTKRNNPEVYDVIIYFLKDLLPPIEKRFPSIKRGDPMKGKRFLFRYKDKPYPPLEIAPNGHISGKKDPQLISIYGESVRDTAKDLKYEIDRIRNLKSKEDAEILAIKFEAFIASIPND